MKPVAAIVFAGLIAGVLSSSLQADIRIATCAAGEGCTCALSPITINDLDLLEVEIIGGAQASDPTRDVMVFEYRQNRASWVSVTPGEIHRQFGGEGDCPIELFPEEPPLVPLDGTWLWRSLNEAVTGCPALMAEALTASRPETLSVRVAWDGRFDPARLASALPAAPAMEMAPYAWRELAENRWLSDNIRSRSCEDGTCVDMALTLAMGLVAEDRITGILSLRSRIEGGAADVLDAFGMKECRVRVHYEIRRTGP